MGLAKADLSIARLYAGLVADESLRERVFRMVVDEFERTKRVVLRLPSQTQHYTFGSFELINHHAEHAFAQRFISHETSIQTGNRQIGLCQSHLNVMDQIVKKRKLIQHLLK